MPLYMLRRDWPGTFRRARRDEAGQILEVYEFAPGEVFEPSPELLEVIAADVPAAFVECAADERGKVRVLPEQRAPEPVETPEPTEDLEPPTPAPKGKGKRKGSAGAEYEPPAPGAD